jgi:DNA-binding winged helix-turn-helix (wHTH) protein/Flp pilus assembly protein TadD
LAAPTAYRFGPFVAQRAGFRLLRDGTLVDTTPRLLDLLLYLLDRAGELVTKEDLLDAVWGDANVTDNALAQAMSELRQALGDDPSAPQYIRTVARRGYRFVGRVVPVADATQAPSSDSATLDANGVAVLDFTNVAADADAAWLSAGIAETVSADLAALGTFKVVDRWRVAEAARLSGGGIQEIAAALAVRFVVVGGFRRHGDRVRITARVLDVASGDAIADAKVDGRLDDIFALQDQVAAQFARELGMAAAPLEAPRPRGRETASLEAYRKVVEGWLKVESLDVGQLEDAIAYFERAVEIDPHYAQAYTGLANAEFASYEATRAQNTPAAALLQSAIAHASKSIALDDELAEAHGSLAMMLVSAWRIDEAQREVRRAVAIEPGSWRHQFRLGHATWGDERLRAGEATLRLYPDFAFAYFQSAMVHVARRRLGDAERVLQHGTAVQDRQSARGERYPALGLHWLLGLVRLAQDDPDEAIDEFERERMLAAPHRLYGREYAMHALVGRGAALLRQGRPDEAASAFAEALTLYPRHPLPLIGVALAGSGSFDDASSAIDEVRRAKPIEAEGHAAVLLGARGDAAGAAAVLCAVLDTAPPGVAAWHVPAEPFLRQVIDAPAFAPALDRLARRAT